MINRRGEYWSGGDHENELEAAAAVQEHIGEAVKAAGLRAMVRAGLTKVQWMCEGCGYDIVGRHPEQCPKCRSGSFDFVTDTSKKDLAKARPDNKS